MGFYVYILKCSDSSYYTAAPMIFLAVYMSIFPVLILNPILIIEDLFASSGAKNIPRNMKRYCTNTR